ncbi:hypothetical protein DAI22_01g245500 [Oryza sativa Japonica Group]|nr:hypothetical protein DAI22_01g245500 [Oryza sativa Japonica Group]KAF2951214.1 hypothetical protein DAI22_01g245500 [Oryza sativa Japonica Group]
MYKSSIQAGKTGSQQINQQEWEMEERKGSPCAWVPSLRSYHPYQIKEKMLSTLIKCWQYGHQCWPGSTCIGTSTSSAQ